MLLGAVALLGLVRLLHRAGVGSLAVGPGVGGRRRTLLHRAVRRASRSADGRWRVG
jgi:hypothetical protein